LSATSIARIQLYLYGKKTVYPPIAAGIFFVDVQEKPRCLFLLAEYLLIIAMPLTNTQALRDAG
jgi:hypothetical protein